MTFQGIVIFVLVLAGIAVLVGIGIAVQQAENKKTMASVLSGRTDFTATYSLAGVDGQTMVAVDADRRSIALVALNGPIQIVPFSSLIEVAVFQDGQSVTHFSRGSQAAGALVGGALFGAAGLVVGGLSGKRTTSGKIRSVALQLTLESLDRPFFSVSLQNLEAETGGIIHQHAMRQANEWLARLKAAMQMADRPA